MTSMNRRRASVLSALVALLLLVTGFIVSSAQASATNIVSIPSDLDACKGVEQNVGLTKHEGGFEGGVYNTFGKSYPIILIHGYGGKDAGQWGDLNQSTDLAARIDNISNAVVATEFQYDVFSIAGLGDLNFGAHKQPLANTIDCIATISRGNGGPGKVIVVGYSEGSAIAHGAASMKSADGKRAIGEEIGQAVTIADARVTYPFPPGLLHDVAWKGFKAPNFPPNVTVHSIGGSVVNAVRNPDGSISKKTETFTDGLVHTENAVSQWTDSPGGGDKHITRCYRLFKSYDSGAAVGKKYTSQITNDKDLSCAHSYLLRDSEETQWDIVNAITAFVNAHCVGSEPSSSPTTNLAAAAVPMAGKTSPAPTPTPTDPGTPGTPGVPSGDPTAPTSPPTTPPSGCVA